MDISYLKILEKIDISDISNTINSELRIISGNNESIYSIILAYLLYRVAKNKIKNVDRYACRGLHSYQKSYCADNLF